MPRKVSNFYELCDRSKRRRANNEAGCSNWSYNSSDEEGSERVCNTFPPSKIVEACSPLNVQNIDNLCSIDDQLENDLFIDFLSSSISDQYNESSDKESNDNIFYEPSPQTESPTGIKHFLRNWAIKHNITDVCLSDLLVGLKDNIDGLSELPLDARTLLKTNIVFEKTIVNPGSYIHFGLEQQLKRLISNIKFSNDVNELKLLLNIDGLPLFKSSPGQVYPILIAIKNVRELQKTVFPVGIYYGAQKPDSMFDFLNKFDDEIVDLASRGITYSSRINMGVKLIGICCDAPAKKDLLGIKGHGGFNSCTKCTVRGETVQGRRVFTDLDCPLRTNEDFLNWVDGDYRQSSTPLLKIPGFDFVNSVVLDYMHLVCLGVVRTMLFTWCNGERPFRLSRHQILRVSEFLNSNKRSLPIEFVRQPRDLKYLLRYKASEYRSFLLYLGPVALKGILDDNKYDNFITLHVAISILLNPKSCLDKNLRDYAGLLLRHFVQNFSNLYANTFISHNFHGLIHLANDAEYFGSILHSFTLDSISAFPFENYLQSIKKMVRGKNRPLEQIGKRLAQLFSVDFSFSSSSTLSDFPEFKGSHTNGPLASFCSGPQYSILLFSNFTIKISPPNNCCSTIKGDIVMIENVCYSNELRCYVIVGRKFLDKKNFFKKPCESSSIGIFEVKTLSSIKCWPITEIITKYIFLEYKQCFITFPLLHTF